jgi:hypothetical protein
MEGNWQGNLVTFEWQPGKWFTLRMAQENRELIGVVRQMLQNLRPAFSYDDSDGMHVVEWHTDGGGERLKEIQGQPQYQGLRRLRKD